MEVRDRIIGIADVIMRIPPLFLIDEILRISQGVFEKELDSNSTEVGFQTVTTMQDTIVNFVSSSHETFFQKSFVLDDDYSHKSFLVIFLKFFACFMGCAAAFCIFLLNTKQLCVFYKYLISVGVIFISYWSNVSTMKAIIAYAGSHGASILDDILGLNLSQVIKYGPGLLIIHNYILQCFLATIFCYIHLAPRFSIVQKLLMISFMAPSILGIHPLPPSFLFHTPVFAALLPLVLCKFVLWYNGYTIYKTIDEGFRYAEHNISFLGISSLFESQWSRLNVPCVLRIFWILRVGEQVVQILGNHYGDETFNYYIMLKTLLVNGCETLTALLGMTSIISFICHYIGCFFQWVLLTDDKDEKSIGTVTAILFYIIALQTGLTSLDKEKRLVRLCRNICLLFTAVLHFIHNIVNPLLMSLSASRNPALHRHIRALAVCTFLIVFPVALLVFLWSHFTMSTWLLAVSVFSVEVILKVVVSLAIYSLFLYDAYQTTFWEQLDDLVYIIRSFGNTVEFAFGLVLFFNGFWILIFESGGAIRAMMMCIHAYFNLWCEAEAGWNTFMKRRTAVNKINSLPEARLDQLKTVDDVCAICYQEMNNAKITRCNHYFHGICLRKWLYVQDRCPLCHEILYKVENMQEPKQAEALLEREGEEEAVPAEHENSLVQTPLLPNSSMQNPLITVEER